MKRGSTGLLENGIDLMHGEAMASTGQLQLAKNVIIVSGADNLSINTERSLSSTGDGSPSSLSAELGTSAWRTHKEIMGSPIPEEVIVDSSAISSTAPNLPSRAKGGTACESFHHKNQTLMTSTWLDTMRGRVEISSARKMSRGESLDSGTHSFSPHLGEGDKDQTPKLRRGSSLKLPPKSNRFIPRKLSVATAANGEPQVRVNNVEKERIFPWMVRDEC